MATLNVTISDALITAYQDAIARRLARDPQHPLPPATLASFQLFVRQWIKGQCQGELMYRAVQGENVDTLLSQLEGL